MAQNPTHIETVFVEESDDRLAKVEEAKRTGNAFQSSGSRGGEVVPYAIANQIAEEKSRQNVDVYNGRPVAAHRKNYIDKMNNEQGFVERTNEQKANAHHSYSADLVRERDKKNKEDAERLANGENIAEERQKENQRLADEYAKASAAYALKRLGKLDQGKPLYEKVGEIVQSVKAEELYSQTLEEQAARLSEFVAIPTANEKPAEDALKTKDAIIATEKGFKEDAAGGVVTDYDQRHEQVEEAKRNDVVLPEQTKNKGKRNMPKINPDDAVAADVAHPPTAEVNKRNKREQVEDDQNNLEVTTDEDAVVGTAQVGFVEPLDTEREVSKEAEERQSRVVPSSKAERKTNKK